LAAESHACALGSDCSFVAANFHMAEAAIKVSGLLIAFQKAA
jgi:hypothetical protein